MTDPTSSGPGDRPETEPRAAEPGAGSEEVADAELAAPPEGIAAAAEHTGASGGPAPTAPTAPVAPEAVTQPDAAADTPPRGQRRITREVHTTTTRSETTTHETTSTVEDVVVAPPVYAAPSSAHPRPVG